MVSKFYGIVPYRCECGLKFRWEPDLRVHARNCRKYRERNVW